VETNVARGLTARRTQWILSGLFAAIFCVAAHAQSTSAADTQSSSGPVAHGTIATVAPVTYDNKYEIFGGLNYSAFKAGPYLTQNMNMGGAELMGTYWLNGVGNHIAPGRLGLAADYRFDAGTTPVAVNHFNLNRTLVFQDMAMGGVQVRGPKNQFFATDLHWLAGMTWANFSHGTKPTPPNQVGLYNNGHAFVSAIGMSVDINESKQFAIRLSPDLMLTHFGTYMDTRFAISGGIIYRFGK
jgi:hypothetical protein